MDLTQFAPQLLNAAADFIEKHPNGADPLSKTLMAAACRAAAGKPLPTVKAVRAAKAVKVSAPAPDTDVPEDNVDILLRAAGLKKIHQTTRKVYGFLLRHQSKAWTGTQVANGTGRDRVATRDMLSRLHRIGAIERVGSGQYRAK